MARILLCVDNEGRLAETYRQPLARDFHQLVVAKGTNDLPERIKESRADLILVDLEALRPGGCSELCGYLDNAQVAQTIPVIGMTDEPASARCLRSNAFILQKPFPMQRLRDAVHGALQALQALPGVERVALSDQVYAKEITSPERSRSAGLFQEVGEAICPFFKKATADWLYPVTGYCRGRPDGKLMIPSIAEYRQVCTTQRFRSCENYQSQR